MVTAQSDHQRRGILARVWYRVSWLCRVYKFRRQAILLGSTGAIALSLVAGPIVHAAVTTPDQQMLSYQYYKAISSCIKTNVVADTDVIKIANAKSGKWFGSAVGGSTPGIGYSLTAAGINVNNDMDVPCSSDQMATIITNAASLWGYSSPIDLLCSSGATRVNKADCRSAGDKTSDGADNNFTFYNSSGDETSKLDLGAFQSSVKSKLGGQEPSLSAPEVNYALYRNAFYTGCLGLGSGSGNTVLQSNINGQSHDQYYYSGIQVVDPATGTSTAVDYYSTSGRKASDKIDYTAGDGNKNISNTCSAILTNMNNSASAYASWINTSGPITSNSAPEQGGGAASDSGTTCSGDLGGLGWVLCPVTTFISSVNDSVYKNIQSLLVVDTSSLLPSSGDSVPAYNAWQQFRNYANVLFVGVFLYIIFSQVSSIGISNYGIKKMLPRLLIAAVLINFSFYICALLVDLSNVAGVLLKSSLTAISTPLDTSWTNAALNILAGTGLAAGTAVGIATEGLPGLLAMLLPLAVFAMLALLMVLLILIARQAVVMLLVVIAPLAFLAYLLPNTENWFKKWWKMFYTLLLLFPIVSVLFGASGLAAGIINNAHPNNIGWNIAALATSALPLFILPSLLKGSLTATGALGAKLQNWGNRATGKVGSKAKEQYGKSYFKQAQTLRKTGQERYRRSQLASRIGGGGGFGNSILKGVRVSNEQKGGVDYLRNAAQSQVAKDEQEAVDNAAIVMQKQEHWTEANRLDKAHDEFTAAMAAGDTVKARAAQKILLNSGTKGLQLLQGGYSELSSGVNDNTPEGKQKAQQYITMMNESETGQKVLSDLNSAGLKGRNAPLAQLAYTAPKAKDGSVNTVDTIASNPGTYGALSDKELVGQSVDNLAKSNVNAETAQRILDNSTETNLTGEKRSILKQFADKQAPTGGASSINNTPPSAGSGSAQSTPSPVTPRTIVPPNNSTYDTPPPPTDGTLNIPRDN